MSGRGGNKGSNFTKTIRINSSNRLNANNSTDTNFMISMGNSLQQVSKLSIMQVHIPNVFYNVFQTNRKFNNICRLQWIDGVNHYSTYLVVPPGYYNVSTLTTEISSYISSLDASITINWTIDDTTGKVTITPTLGGTVTSLSILPLVASDFSNLNLPPVQDYDPLGLLGININTQTLVWNGGGVGASVTGLSLPSMNNPSVCYIASNALAPSNSYDEGGKISNELIQISLADTPHGAIATFDCKQDVLCEIEYGRPRPINLIDIQVVDHDGDPLDTMGQPINLYLRVWLNEF